MKKRMITFLAVCSVAISGQQPPSLMPKTEIQQPAAVSQPMEMPAQDAALQEAAPQGPEVSAPTDIVPISPTDTISPFVAPKRAQEMSPDMAPKKKKAKKSNGDSQTVPADSGVQSPAEPVSVASVANGASEPGSQQQPTLPMVSAEYEFDIEAKKKATIALVKRAAQELAKADKIDEACNKFTHTKEFIEGDLYMFVYDMKGVTLANGEDANTIWSNRWDLTDWVGTKIVQEIIKKARSGGGWVTYGWHNTTKISYIQRVDRDGTSYAIGAGYYPQSKEVAVVNLVKGGVALFNEIKKIGQPADWAFSRMSYPSGRFVAGNLYLYALNFQGDIVAQGERPGLIGSNALDYTHAKGQYLNRDIIKKLETASDGIWIDYISKRAKKRAYAEKVIGSDGIKYFIACGYYPDAGRNRVEELVRGGYQYMKTSGISNAVGAFQSRTDDTYRYGDLFLVVYDMKGKIIAHGDNLDATGQNRFTDRDDDGQLYIQNMIKHATKEGSWSNAKVKGSFESSYAQRIDLGLESFVIACSYYPVSKTETLMLLVQSASSFLRDNPREKAFASFVRPNGNFHRGDLQIVVVDEMGLCYAYGDDAALIWRNLINITDDEGRPFIKQFINRAGKGSDFVKIKLNRANKVNYVSSVEKDGKKYIIASGFYQ